MKKPGVRFHMQVSGWFLLLLCGLIGVWLSGLRLGLLMGALLLASLLLHEVGHMVAARVLQVPVREFGLCLGGAYNRRAPARRRRDEIFISAAGPAMNLLLAAPMLLLPGMGRQLALGNLALGLVNLLPLPSSDGMRILHTIGSAISARVAVARLEPSHVAWVDRV